MLFRLFGKSLIKTGLTVMAITLLPAGSALAWGSYRDYQKSPKSYSWKTKDSSDTGDELVDRAKYRYKRNRHSREELVVVESPSDSGTLEPALEPAPSSAMEPASVPTVNLTATESVVASNESASLNWTATNAESCSAADGWFGSKATSGAESSAALTQDTTFTLVCTGPGGTASDSITVKVQLPTGIATLNWTPPTTRLDGSGLSDLEGYKVYYGTSPGSYSSTIIIDNPGISTFTVENLLSATYYFVVTAFDASGVESIHSNEASKTINK